MGQKRFVYIRRDDTPSQPVTLLATMNAAGRALEPGTGPFVLTQDGDVVKEELTRVETLERLRGRLYRGDVGPVYRIRDRGGNPVFRVREVIPAAKQLDTNGNAKADAYWSAVKAEFPDISFLGAYVCKNIIGNGISQHSFGNAVDLGAPSMAALERIAGWDVDHAAELDLEHVIVNQRIWTRGYGWHPYTGETHYHVHVDFTPSLSGSCGARN